MAAKFMLDRDNRKLFGVCAGLANMVNVDPMLMRIGWVVATLFFGLPVLLYVIIALIAD